MWNAFKRGFTDDAIWEEIGQITVGLLIFCIFFGAFFGTAFAFGSLLGKIR